jgi:hypothetical protein
MNVFEAGILPGIGLSGIIGGVVCKSYGVTAVVGGVVGEMFVGVFAGWVYGFVIIFLQA